MNGDGTVTAAEAAYGPPVLAATPRLLGLMDRESPSASYGAFDREYWAWKFRDHPVSMVSSAFWPLTLLWTMRFSDNCYYREPRLLVWIEAAIDYLCRRQHRNGAIDSIAPFTQDHGTTLGFAHFLHLVLERLGSSLSREVRDRALETIARGCAFAIRGDETYAFITNHQALCALGFRAGAEVTGNARFGERAEELVRRIVERQDADGWYREYDGFDPGYESLALVYLSRYWEATGDEALLASMRRAVAFSRYAVQPDGAFGGDLGSRHTSLYFPAGFERLARVDGSAAAVALFMRAHLSAGNVVTPVSTDMHNLPVLAFSYLEAMEVERRAPATATPENLPCESLRGLRAFDSGLVAYGSDRYYALVHGTRGGMSRVVARDARQAVYEDAGYLVESTGRKWTSQAVGLGSWSHQPSGAIVARTVFAETRQILPSSGRFLVLRLLNLTAFRSVRLGRWILRWIIGRLVSPWREGPLRLVRRVELTEDRVRFEDRLSTTRRLPVTALALPRTFTGIHMGSSRYFRTADLLSLPAPPLERAAEQLAAGEARVCFQIVFDGEGRARLDLPEAELEAEAAPDRHA